MKRLILVTVGTSLRGKEELAPKVKKFIDTLKDQSIKKTEITKAALKGNYASQQTVWEETALKYLEGKKKLTDFTAEIASLKLMSLNPEKDRVVLLCSDTPDGAFCARVNIAYIKKHLLAQEEFKPSERDLRIIEGLEVADPKRFKAGLENLYLILEEYATLAEQEQRELLINITGGYKGAIPFIAIFAYLNHHTLNYFHEDGSLLLKIEAMIPEPGSSTSLKVTIEQKIASNPKPEIYLCPTN